MFCFGCCSFNFWRRHLYPNIALIKLKVKGPLVGQKTIQPSVAHCRVVVRWKKKPVIHQCQTYHYRTTVTVEAKQEKPKHLITKYHPDFHIQPPKPLLLLSPIAGYHHHLPNIRHPLALPALPRASLHATPPLLLPFLPPPPPLLLPRRLGKIANRARWKASAPQYHNRLAGRCHSSPLLLLSCALSLRRRRKLVTMSRGARNR